MQENNNKIIPGPKEMRARHLAYNRLRLAELEHTIALEQIGVANIKATIAQLEAEEAQDAKSQ